MIVEEINLKQVFPMLKNDVTIQSYCPSNFNEFSIGVKRKCVLILPGGGYEFLSEREAEPVALRFVGHDIACFTLKYSVQEKVVYPYPLIEVLAAIAYIKKNALKYNVDKDRISLLGFSAGGHLAASAAIYSKNESFASMLNVDLKDLKIAGCILGYPIISMYIGNGESIRNLTHGDEKLKEFYSIEKYVTSSFPKTFIWFTTFDTSLALQHSLALVNELSDKKVFFEMHIYPMLDHGQALCDRSVYYDSISEEELRTIEYNTQWVENAIHFVKEYI